MVLRLWVQNQGADWPGSWLGFFCLADDRLLAVFFHGGEWELPSHVSSYIGWCKIDCGFTVLNFQRRQWHHTPVLSPGKSHRWKSLVGCSPWGHEESDTTEWLHFHFSLSCIGEGNGNPLQGSCLENPSDGGAWWAAVYGVTQSWTRLTWLRSSMIDRSNF